MVILRSFTPADWPALSQYQYPGMSEFDCQKLIADFNAGTHDGRRFQMLAVEHSGELVGYVSLFEQEDGTASEGVEIYAPFRRKGFAFEAIRQLLAQAKGYHAIIAQIRKDNVASLALHDKLGFQITNEFVNRRGHPVYALSLTLHQEVATSLRSSQ